MKNYAKMLETVKAIQDTFGSAEFTRKDYTENVEKKNYDVYCSAVALNTKNFIIKKTREEDYIVKTDWGNKEVGTRFFYEINEEFLTELKKSLKKDSDDIELQITKLSNRIVQLEQKKEEKQTLLKVLENLCENL